MYDPSIDLGELVLGFEAFFFDDEDVAFLPTPPTFLRLLSNESSTSLVVESTELTFVVFFFFLDEEDTFDLVALEELRSCLATGSTLTFFFDGVDLVDLVEVVDSCKLIEDTAVWGTPSLDLEEEEPALFLLVVDFLDDNEDGVDMAVDTDAMLSGVSLPRWSVENFVRFFSVAEGSGDTNDEAGWLPEEAERGDFDDLAIVNCFVDDGLLFWLLMNNTDFLWAHHIVDVLVDVWIVSGSLDPTFKLNFNILKKRYYT
jgi:hypothetical protein